MAQENAVFREFPSKYVEWSINNFFDLPTTKDFKLESPPFLIKSLKWYLEVFPCTCRKDGFAGSVGLYICKKDSTEEHRVACNMGIKVSDTIVYQTAEKVHLFGKKSEKLGREDFCDRVSCFFSTLDKPLTVFCNLRFLDRHSVSSSTTSYQTTSEETTKNTPEDDDYITSSSTDSKYSLSSLIENFKDMYLSRRYTDVTITVKSREFHAHRSVIAVRSTVFASMFDHDTVERSTGRVKISDCDPDCFNEFLLFLYTGKLDIVTANNAVDLYQTSEKYDVRELKKECVECMARELSEDNFSDVVQLATMYNECALLESATNYFIENAEAILLTTKWQIFLEENLTLGNELFLKYIKSKKKVQD